VRPAECRSRRGHSRHPPPRHGRSFRWTTSHAVVYDAKPMLTRVVVVLLLAAVVPARGETAREILDRRKALDDGARHWTDRHQKMKLTIYDSSCICLTILPTSSAASLLSASLTL